MGRELDESEGAQRRIPWLSYVLVVACAAAFFTARAARVEVDAVVDTHLASAQDYFRDHPYLVVPQLLKRRVSNETAARLQHTWESDRTARSAPPIPERIQAREQRELDRIVESAALRVEELPTRRWGLRPSDPAPQQYLSHVLFHGGWLHLILNLSLLVVLGYFVEGAFGFAIFACVACAGSIGAAALFVARNPGLEAPLVGTSGLLAALLGAFAVRFVGSRGEVPYFPVLLASGLLLALPVWFGLEWSVEASGGVSADAMGAWNPSAWLLLGGFASGALAAFAVRLLGLEGRVQTAEAEAELRKSSVDPQLDRALQERSAGHLDEAFNLLSSVLRRRPDDVDAALTLWQVANDLGRPRAATGALLRVIRGDIQRADERSAVAHWLELAAYDLDADADTTLLMRIAPLLRDAGHGELASRALRHALARSEGTASATIAARVAREAADLDPGTAQAAAWRALGSMELDLQERQDLESLIGVLGPQAGDDGPEEPVSFEPAAVVSAADLLAPEAESTGLELPETRPDPIDIDDRSRPLELVEALPCEFDADGLQIELDGGQRKRVRFDRIEAVAVAAIEGLGPKAVIVIDLVLNWMSLTAEPLHVIRLRTDRFDPRGLVEGAAEPIEALRAVVARLQIAGGAIALPDQQSANGVPFAAFKSLAKYHSDVLMVEDDGD